MFRPEPFRVRMGVRRLDLHDWLDVDQNFDAQVAEKADLLARYPERVIARSDTPDPVAEAELADDVAAHLLRQCPELEPWCSAVRSAAGSSVEAAGLMCQEDWMVLSPRGGRLVVTSASVSFPTRWSLAEKTALDVTQVHGPVHEYDPGLAARVDGFLERLEPGELWGRRNWNVVDEPQLHQPVARHHGPGPNPALTTANAGEMLHLRVERETFRRLPTSRAVVFGIRVHTHPLRELATQPERLASLSQALHALPPETAAYKGVPAFIDAFDGWVRAHDTTR